MAGKNLRLLGLEESPYRQPDIHETIRNLMQEISRGEETYTPVELKKLEQKLEEYRVMLRRLTEP